MILGKNERNAITDSLLRIEKERRGFNFLRLDCNAITGMTRCTVHVVDLHGRSFPLLCLTLTLLSQFTHFSHTGLDYYTLHARSRVISRHCPSLSSVLDRFLPTFVFFWITLDPHALPFRAIVGRDLYFESFEIAPVYAAS